MGKYSAVKNKYPKFEEEPTYQKLIDDAKLFVLGTLETEGANIQRLAAVFASWDAKKKALFEKYGSKDKTDAEYEVNIYRKALSQLLEEALSNEGMTSVALASGALVYLEDTPIPVVKDKPVAITKLLEEMPELLTISFKGLTKKQYQSLIVWAEKQKLAPDLGIHDQTLKSEVRAAAVAGRPAPAGTEIFFLTQAKLKNGNKSEEESQ